MPTPSEPPDTTTPNADGPAGWARLWVSVMALGCLACGGLPSLEKLDDLARLWNMVDDPEAYADDVERRCADDHAVSCTSLGVHYAFGTYGRERDYAQARIHVARGCALGDPYGCYELGVLNEHGRGADPDHREARRLYTQACAGGVSNGCYNMGQYYKHGKGGVEKNPDIAASWFAKACAAGDESSCVD